MPLVRCADGVYIVGGDSCIGNFGIILTVGFVMKKFYGILKETFREYEAYRLSSEVIQVFPLRHEAEAALNRLKCNENRGTTHRMVDVFLDKKILAAFAKE